MSSKFPQEQRESWFHTENTGPSSRSFEPPEELVDAMMMMRLAG